jgi:hypothetical protein
VYLKYGGTQSLRQLDSMKRELARLMRSAGYEIEWRGPRDSNIDTGAFLAVVEFRGDCDASSGKSYAGSAPSGVSDLASTFVSDGRVLPFSWVNCANLANILAPALADQPGARADFIFGRAVARLLAHEFYHMLMQTRDHTRNGVSKPCFTLSDLLDERFEFEASALAQLQSNHLGTAAESIPAETPRTASGRSR